MDAKLEEAAAKFAAQLASARKRAHREAFARALQAALGDSGTPLSAGAAAGLLGAVAEEISESLKDCAAAVEAFAR